MMAFELEPPETRSKPLPPEPLIDEEVLGFVLRDLTEKFLNEHPYFAWRNSIGYVANVEGKYRKFSKRTYHQTVASFMAKHGYERRGIIHELVADRVRTGLAARDL